MCIQMSQKQKNFVRFKGFDDDEKRRSKEKKKTYRKPYTQKYAHKPQVFHIMLKNFELLSTPTTKVTPLIQMFSKFFDKQAHGPTLSGSTELLNEYIKLYKMPNPNSKKLREAKGTPPPPQFDSQEEPDWDSDQEANGTLTSKKIDQKIIARAQGKFVSIIQKADTLQEHEKQFLEDYYRSKRLEEPQELNKEKSAQEHKPSTWSINSFIDMGLIQQVNKNDKQFQKMRKNEEDDSNGFCEPSSQKSSSSENEEDDILGNEEPTVTIQKREQNADTQSKGKGTVHIVNNIFSKIAQRIGLLSSSCIWVVSNTREYYKMSTQYMDQYYRAYCLMNHFPFISLNHSEYVHYNDVQTEAAFKIFKEYNTRKKRQIVPKAPPAPKKYKGK